MARGRRSCAQRTAADRSDGGRRWADGYRGPVRYVALLRGIGPTNRNMRNERLRGVAEGLGLRDVGTVISSGNLVFDADPADVSELEARFEEAWTE